MRVIFRESHSRADVSKELSGCRAGLSKYILNDIFLKT